jgi:hypothetical protein
MKPEPIKRYVWKRAPNPNSRTELSRLLPIEEQRLRAAMDVLRIRYGNWASVAAAMRINKRGICVGRRISPAFATRVARLLGESLGDILSGKFPRANECPMCGHRPRGKVKWAAAGTGESAGETVGRLRALRFGSKR